MYYDCTVSIKVGVAEETYRIERNLSFFREEEANESVYYPPDLRLDLNHSIFHDEILSDEEIPEEGDHQFDSSPSVGEKVLEHLQAQLDLAVKRNHGLIILDDALARLPHARARVKSPPPQREEESLY